MERKMALYWLPIVLILTLLSGASLETIKELLKKNILENYDAAIIPHCEANEVVTVTLDMAMRQLIDFDEPLQIIKANIWIRMKWTDCRLTWNASDYNGTQNIILPFEAVWVPDITLYDNTGETFFGKEDFAANVYSDGTVYYNFPSVIHNRCVIDVSHFPYDVQICKFVFGSWSYHGLELDFVPKNPSGDLSSMDVNSEWQLPSFLAKRHAFYYSCCPEPYPDVTFYLEMRRKPRFHVVSLIIPSSLIAGMGVFGFLLPCESGEKVSLEITVMLSLAVFQILIADSLPHSADHVPYLAIYFDFTLFLVGYATIMAVVVNYLHYGGKKPIPTYVKRIFFGFLGRMVGVTPPESYKQKIKQYIKENIELSTERQESRILSHRPVKSSIELSGGTSSTASLGFENVTVEVLTETEQHLDKIEKTLEHLDSDITQAEEWKILATIVDRLACVIYLIAGLIGAAAIFGLLTSEHD